MNLPSEQIKIIANGAYFHDIGKIKIPTEILVKPSSLTASEMAIVQHHCLYGYQFLSNAPHLAEVAQIVYSHHENYDGTGYPRRLAGEEIPLGARIVAVANTLDFITIDLPYRRKRPLTNTRAEILRCSGTQFDPDVVEAFLGLPDVARTKAESRRDHR